MINMEVKQQAIFNYAAMRLAMNVRKNLKNFPPELHADFLTMSDFIQDFSDDETNGKEKQNEAAERGRME